jgi:hypothetical protein
MPRVAPAPSTTSWAVLNPSLSSAAPQMAAYRPSDAHATTLFTIGAHIIGPNRSRALSTWPTSTKTP